MGGNVWQQSFDGHARPHEDEVLTGATTEAVESLVESLRLPPVDATCRERPA